jgi:hypothetical protein
LVAVAHFADAFEFVLGAVGVPFLAAVLAVQDLLAVGVNVVVGHEMG